MRKIAIANRKGETGRAWLWNIQSKAKWSKRSHEILHRIAGENTDFLYLKFKKHPNIIRNYINQTQVYIASPTSAFNIEPLPEKYEQIIASLLGMNKRI